MKEKNKMAWIPLHDKEPELSKQYLVFDPQAVIKCYTAFYLPYKEGDRAGYFNNGISISFSVTHYCEIPDYTKLLS